MKLIYNVYTISTIITMTLNKNIAIQQKYVIIGMQQRSGNRNSHFFYFKEECYERENNRSCWKSFR